MGESYPERIDLLFKGVAAVKLTREVSTLLVRGAQEDELDWVVRDCGLTSLVQNGSKAYIIEGGASLGYVVALSMFVAADHEHGANPSALFFDIDARPVPEVPFWRYV